MIKESNVIGSTKVSASYTVTICQMNGIIYERLMLRHMTITPEVFEYYTPSTVADAVGLLEKYGDEAKVLAGGQSLIPLMKTRFVSFSHIVDISRIEDLDFIQEDDRFLKIGALTTVQELGTSLTVKKGYEILKEAAEQIADPLVRNMGTVGGNLSHGDAANDLPAVMVSLDAVFMVQGPNGNREIKAEDFFLDTLTTALEHGEILYEVRIPRHNGKQAGSYIKQKKSAADFSVAAVAANVAVDGNGKVQDARVALTAVGPTVIKSRKAGGLAGKKITEEVAAEAAREISEESDPVADFYGSVEYKKKVLRYILKESLLTAYRRAMEA